MKTILLIYNPLSGEQKFKYKLDYIISEFQKRDILVYPFRLSYKEDNLKLTDIILKQKFEYIIVGGGDGTLNSVVNIVLNYKLDIPLGVIPVGTSNDFARCLNIPDDLEECLNIILNDNMIKVDVGRIGEDRYFLSTVAGGLFVNASFETDLELKKNFGTFAYYLKALSEVKNIKSFPLLLETPEKNYQEDALLFLILSGKHAAGFTNIIDDANLQDGLMDILVIRNCPPIDLAGAFLKFLSTGQLESKFILKIKTDRCFLSTDKELIVSIDGEKGVNLPQNITFLKQALKIFVK